MAVVGVVVEADVGAEETPYGQIVTTLDLPVGNNRGFSTSIQAPAPMLFALMRKCAPFRALMREVLEACPCSMARPWHIVVYFDGITPEAGLRKKKKRNLRNLAEPSRNLKGKTKGTIKCYS